MTRALPAPDIVVKGALSPEEVAAANAVLDERSAETLEISKAARAKEEHLQDNPLHWGPVFRGLLDNPRLTPILEELIGAHAGSRCELPRKRPAAPRCARAGQLHLPDCSMSRDRGRPRGGEGPVAHVSHRPH